MDAGKREKSLIANLVKGKISSGELEELRALAKHDPFLSDAIEGYLNAPQDHSEALQHLRGKVLKAKQRRSWLSAAASIVILFGLSLFLVNRYQPSISEDLAMQPDREATHSDDESATRIENQIEPEEETTDILLQNAVAEAAKEKEFSKTARKRQSSSSGISEISTPVEMEEEMAESTAIEAPSTEKIDDALAFSQRESSPLVTIQGKVFDNVGEPLIGASVLQPDLGIGTQTDLEGRFVLTTPDTNQDIAISHTGYKSKVVSDGISPNKNLDIRLEENSMLDEVVVTSLPKTETARSRATSASPTEKDQKAFQSFVEENLNYPPAAKEAGITGTVALSFELNTDGKPVEIRVTKSLGYGCDQEAIRLLKNSPTWAQSKTQIPSKSSSFSVTIPFILE